MSRRVSRRVPIVPTVIVALAMAAMVALGLWQLLDRLPQKEAFLRQIATNPVRPPVAFPRNPDDALLFRRTVVTCARPTATRLVGAGAKGYRLIAQCSGIEGGPAFAVQLGTTHNPRAAIAWAGGSVSGYIAHAPEGQSLIGSLFDHRSPETMVVADRPATGLSPNTAPDLASIPNNHLAYAGQWFLFAAVAGIVYTLALRHRRGTDVANPYTAR